MKIKANLPSGFPEFLPEEQIIFDRIKQEIERTYQLFGAIPIETPAIEQLDTLLSKGGEQKEMYAIHRVKGENDESKMGLHFDLTVPLARYVSEHYNELIFPFKRYQIQPVWRGERPQSGRYRQFYQADIDVIDRGELPLIYDAEMPTAVYYALSNIGLDDIQIHINNRKVIDALLGYCKVPQSLSGKVFKLIDEIFSIEKDNNTNLKHIEKFIELGIEKSSATMLLSFFEEIKMMNNQQIISFVEGLAQKNIDFEIGVGELKEVYKYMQILGIPETKIVINLQIVRGLDYYTGSVYETLLLSEPHIGSICSGGRYENLVGTFSNEPLPGVGISIGLSRLANVLIKKEQYKIQTTAKVFVANLNEEYLPKYNETASILRNSGIGVEVMMASKKLKKQLSFAHKKGFQFVLLMGETELENHTFILKNMSTSEQSEVKDVDLVKWIRQNLKT